MHRSIVSVQFHEDLTLHATYVDGEIVLFDVKTLFHQKPIFRDLLDTSLFLNGDIDGYGVVWNDDLDIASEYIYDHGKHVSSTDPDLCRLVGEILANIREQQNISQRELSKKTGIIQADISKIEQGKGNPTLKTIQRLMKALQVPTSAIFNIPAF